MTELTRVDRAPRRIDECKDLIREVIGAAGPDGAPAATIAQKPKRPGSVTRPWTRRASNSVSS